MRDELEFFFSPDIIPSTEMGLENCEKGGRYCGGPGAAEGPRLGPGATPWWGSGVTTPEAEAFFEKKYH